MVWKLRILKCLLSFVIRKFSTYRDRSKLKSILYFWNPYIILKYSICFVKCFIKLVSEIQKVIKPEQISDVEAILPFTLYVLSSFHVIKVGRWIIFLKVFLLFNCSPGALSHACTIQACWVRTLLRLVYFWSISKKSIRVSIFFV